MNHSLNGMKRLANTILVWAITAGVTVFALFTPLYAADYSTTDELKLMEGFLSPSDKLVTRADALTPPFDRWSYLHTRMIYPSAPIAAANKAFGIDKEIDKGIDNVKVKSPEDEAETLRKAQDPLADVKALMTDNTIAFGTADHQTSYSFQLQPVYSIPTNLGFNFIARGIIPIAGAQEGAGLPKLGTEPIGGSGLTWGMSDIMLQGFFVPKTGSGIKFGFGPQLSLRTRTDSVIGGPGWGGGLAGVVFGFAGPLAYGGIIGHQWGQDSFNLTTLQPIVFYNTELFGGSYIGYNNSITYDWSASGSNAWQVPVGLTAGKTFILESGYMIDMNLGGYYLATAPSGGADWQFKFGVSLFFP